MSPELTVERTRDRLRGVRVFLGAGIPDPKRWSGHFDAREITDAVVAATRAILSAGGTIVTGAHPTISPLILYVASELGHDWDEPHVLVYQSAVLDSVMPDITRRFEEDGVARLRITEAKAGERPRPGEATQSLLRMRRRMFADMTPAAAIFVGGMEGVVEEFQLLRDSHPQVLTYPVAKPGGEAANLVEQAPSSIRQTLRDSDIYPTIFRKVVDDISSHPEARLSVGVGRFLGPAS